MYSQVSKVFNNKNLLQDDKPKYKGCAFRSPASSQNQVGSVKAICDLARMTSCTIIIINNTNLINFYSFQCVIKRGFLKIRCLCVCTHPHTLDEPMFTHTHVPISITYNIRPTRDFMPRAVPSQPSKFAPIFAIKCLQCRHTKMSKSAEVLIQSS